MLIKIEGGFIMFKKNMRLLTMSGLILSILIGGVACGKDTTNIADKGKTNNATKPEFTLKFGHDQAPEHAYNQAALYFADQVNKKTNGRVEIKVFPNAQLGNESVMLDSLKMGTLDFCISSTSNASSHVPEFGLLSLSYLYKDKEHFLKVANDEQLFNKFSSLSDEMDVGFKLLTFMPNGVRELYATKEIKGIEDIQGFKIRVMASPIETKVWNAIGASPTTVPFSEVYTALQTNLVQGAENTKSSYYAAKHNEVAPYYIKTGHQWMMTEIWASSEALNKLPDDIKKIISEVSKDTSMYGFNKQQENDALFLQKAIDESGVKVVEIDKKPFEERVKPLQDIVAKELHSEDILARIRELGK